jgi:hypothetical protein
MSVATYVMFSKGFFSTREHLEHAMIGMFLGLVIGSLVPLEKTKQ